MIKINQFLWQICLLRCVSFCDKSCHIRKIARADDLSLKMWQISSQAQNVANKLASAIFWGQLRDLALFLRITAAQCDYWHTKLWTVDKYLPCHLSAQLKNCHIKIPMVEIKLLTYNLVFINIFMSEINSFNFVHSKFSIVAVVTYSVTT